MALEVNKRELEQEMWWISKYQCLGFLSLRIIAILNTCLQINKRMKGYV